MIFSLATAIRTTCLRLAPAGKYDGWVTEFVACLKKELDATFKEEISVYFDENPVDGLLETHNVDKSLEEN